MKTRWIVRNAVLTPAAGNGIWSRHWSRLAALRSRRRILEFRHGSGCYVLPVGGLIVCKDQ